MSYPSVRKNQFKVRLMGGCCVSIKLPDCQTFQKSHRLKLLYVFVRVTKAKRPFLTDIKSSILEDNGYRSVLRIFCFNGQLLLPGVLKPRTRCLARETAVSSRFTQ